MVVYIVDNDPLVLQTLLDFLSELGHTAVPILSARELLVSIDEEHPKADVVIVKPEAIGPDCLDVLREIHHRHADLAFILVSGAYGGFPAQETVSCGVYAFLRQPIRLSELELSLIRLRETARSRR
jgi:DNA-binding NtrC family response regulator